MNNCECICIIFHKNTDLKKGKFKFLNFYLKGLLFEIKNQFSQTDYKKILIKNNYNCFLPEKLLFYNIDEELSVSKEMIENDMKMLNIKNYIIFK